MRTLSRDFQRRLSDRLLVQLDAKLQSVEKYLPVLQNRSCALNVSASIAYDLLECLWGLFAYPLWKPVGDRWSGPGREALLALAHATLEAWDLHCTRVTASNSKPPYYHTPAGVSAVTLRRAALGRGAQEITPAERVCIADALTRYSPGSDHLAAALWHAKLLVMDVSAPAGLIATVLPAKQRERDYRRHVTVCTYQALWGDHPPNSGSARLTLALAVRQHYAWVSGGSAADISLANCAAFAAMVSEVHPGLLPGPDLVSRVSQAISANESTGCSPVE